jgi:hypothetical protein
MYIKCHECENPIHYINIIPSPIETISVTILSLSGIKLENLWGADIKCKCGHTNTGVIFESKNGIMVSQKEYRLER